MGGRIDYVGMGGNGNAQIHCHIALYCVMQIEHRHVLSLHQNLCYLLEVPLGLVFEMGM